MTIAEPLIILQEKGSKDAFDKKCKMADMAYTFMTCDADLVLSTTASKGLELIKKWENQLPIGGLSSPANVSWHCPAVYLDDAFVAIPENKEFVICKWALGAKFSAPVTKKSLDLTPFRIWNFLNSGVLIGYNTGKVDVMDANFKVLLETDPIVPYQEVLFMDCQKSKNDLKLVVVGVLKDKKELHCSLYTFERQHELPVLVSNMSFDALGFTNFKNLGFSFDGRHFSVFDEKFIISTFNIRSNSIEKVSHDLSVKLKDGKVLSFKLVSNNHIAFLSVVKVGLKFLPQVTIWDNRYGTLQSTLNIDLVSLPDKLNRTQGCLNGFYDASGYFLTISLAYLSSSMVNTTHLLLPVKLEPISLKSILGKLADNLESTNPIATLDYSKVPRLSQECIDLNSLNRDMLSKLLEQKETDKFEVVFKDWIVANLELLSKQNKLSKKLKGNAWVDAAAFSISQTQIKAIATACFDSEKGLWPRNAIKYCLKNHIFHSRILNSSLIERIISKDDVELLLIAIHNLLDISESEWSAILRYILGLSSTLELDKLVPNNITDAMDNSKSQVQDSLLSGQDYICSLVFNAPKNYQLMARALGSLGANEMEILLKWISEIIIMKDERFMWWAWGAVGTDLSDEKLNILFNRRKMAIDALSLLLDSKLVLISTSPKLLETLQDIRQHINQECNFASYFQKRVFGMLKQFKKEESMNLSQKKCVGGRRWQRMVSDLQDNSGSYCIEVLKF